MPYILYAVIALLIMRPFFGDGFLLLLDMPWTPNIQLSDYLRNIDAGLPLTLLFKMFSYFIPVYVIQKILLTLIFFLAGLSIYKLGRQYKTERILAFAGGCFYMVNPWVYERFLAGHWKVFLGYAVFPLSLYLFDRVLKSPGKLNLAKFYIFLAVYPALSIHWAYISYLFLIIYGLVYLFKNKKINSLIKKDFLVKMAVLVLAIIAFNSYWLFGFWGQDSVFPKIDEGDFRAFATVTDTNFGIYFNVLSLYGFWSAAWFLPKDILGMWWLLSIFCISLSALGLYSSLRSKRTFAYVITLLFGPLLVLSVGYGSGFSQKITEAVYHLLPGFKGLRETEKLVGLLAFSYALLMPLGMERLFKLCAYPIDGKKWRKGLAFLFLLVITYFSTFGIFNSFDKQLSLSKYPLGWYEAEEILSADTERQSVLVLPWKGYPRLSFAANRRIANPARGFFSFPVVVSKTLDNKLIQEVEQPEWDNFVSSWQKGEKADGEVAKFLEEKDISHVILLKIEGWQDYLYLYDREFLEKKYEDESIVIWAIH